MAGELRCAGSQADAAPAVTSARLEPLGRTGRGAMGLEPSVAVCGAFGRGPPLELSREVAPQHWKTLGGDLRVWGSIAGPQSPQKALGCGIQSTKEHLAALMGLQGCGGQVRSMEWGCTDPSGLASSLRGRPRGGAGPLGVEPSAVHLPRGDEWLLLPLGNK